MRFTLEDIFNIPTAVIYNPDLYKSVSSISIDSRTIKKNSMFVAIKGENFDGHDFVNNAIEKGAKAVIINKRKLKYFDDLNIPIITVNNTTDAYAELAKIWRSKYKGKIISITGSNGKTTTKEILAHLLASKYKVHKTFANNNNQIGVPLTILSASPSADIIVLEHGTNHPGEIEYTAKVADPDYALITNIGNSHIEFLKSKQKILQEKIQLFKYCKNEGKVFINNDDHLLCKLKKDFKNRVVFGFQGRCDVKGRRLKIDRSKNERIAIEGFGKKIDLEIPLLGSSNSNNFLASAAVALKLGIGKSALVKQSKTLQSVKGRMKPVQLKNALIIDDTYNSNPDSVKIALEALAKFNHSQTKILVFGDMLELGKDSEKFHKDVAALISKKKIDAVFSIGKNSKVMNDHLKNIGLKKHFRTRKSLINELKKRDFNKSVILVKGSRGMHMEEFVDEIKAGMN